VRVCRHVVAGGRHLWFFFFFFSNALSFPHAHEFVFHQFFLGRSGFSGASRLNLPPFFFSAHAAQPVGLPGLHKGPGILKVVPLRGLGQIRL